MFKANTRKLFVRVSLFSAAMFLSGCGLWRDFTTYFNTYYNAKTLFDQTEESIIKQRKDIFAFREDRPQQLNQQSSQQNNFQTGLNPSQSTQNLDQQNNQMLTSQNTQPGGGVQGPQNTQSGGGMQTSGNVTQDLTRVIEKCSKILQYEKESGYFADALFLTGKSLYYQQEYTRAQRKFLELAGLGETKYSLQNNLWLAKTYLQLHNFDEGLKLIEEVKAEALKTKNDQLFIDASITKISFFIFREEYSSAIDECVEFLKNSPDEETSALVCFELGKIYLSMDDNEKALAAFAEVLKYSPSFEVEFQSRLEHARLLKKLKKIDQSEEEFTNLQYSGKFKNNLDEVMVELGQIYYEKKEIKRAMNLFKEVDSTYRVNSSAGIAEMKIGQIYERVYRDYDSTFKYYNKVAISLAPHQIKSEASDKIKSIQHYFQLREEIKIHNLNLLYKTNPTRFDRDSIDYDIGYRQYQEENKKAAESQTSQTNQQSTDPSQALAQQQQAQLQLQQQQLLLKKKEKDLTLAQLITLNKIKKPVRPKITEDSIRTVLSQSYYNLANLFFSELEVPDSARIYFKKIVNEYSSKPVYVKTLFSLGTYYETINDTLKADSIYKHIYENYQKDPMGNAAGKKLGLIKEIKNAKIEAEKETADANYLNAENIYYQKKFLSAIDSLRFIVNKFPKSKAAPKALYFMGLIYEYDLKMYDSAAAVYGRLVADYKTSSPANLVFDKVMFYKGEMQKKADENKPKLASSLPVKKSEPAADAGTQKSALQPESVNPAGGKTGAKDTTKGNIKNEMKPSVKDTSNNKPKELVKPIPYDKLKEPAKDTTKSADKDSIMIKKPPVKKNIKAMPDSVRARIE